MLTPHGDWVFADDYMQAYCETSDPRILAVIEHDPFTEIDGDAYSPAAWRDTEEPYWHTYRQDSVVDAYFRARYYYSHLHWMRRDDMVRRYLRLFHGVLGFAEVSGMVHRETVLIFDTVEHREHCGIPLDEPAEAVLNSQELDWQCAIDGDAWGIGYAVIPDRLTHDDPIPDWSELETEWSYGGVLGQHWATDLAFTDNQFPDLPDFLPLEVAS